MQKTGTLFVAASEVGAASRGSRRDWIGPIREFAMNMGILFQIADDSWTASGRSRRPGRTSTDEGKRTLVSVLGPDEARAEACHRLEAAERALDPLGAAGQPLDEMVRSAPGPGNGQRS